MASDLIAGVRTVLVVVAAEGREDARPVGDALELVLLAAAGLLVGEVSTIVGSVHITLLGLVDATAVVALEVTVKAGACLCKNMQPLSFLASLLW